MGLNNENAKAFEEMHKEMDSTEGLVETPEDVTDEVTDEDVVEETTDNETEKTTE